MTFQMRKTVAGSYSAVLAKLPEALKSEGFGVLTEIDVQDTLKRKLGVDFRPYRIVGACNPALAHQALQADLEIGVMLPCNVVVYAADDGQTVVSAIDPTQTMSASDNPKLKALSETVRDKLARVIDQLA
jgi:uncharacterized protein (DUF302 family)